MSQLYTSFRRDASAFIVLKETAAVPKFSKISSNEQDPTKAVHENTITDSDSAHSVVLLHFLKLGPFARTFVLLRLIIPAFMNKPFDRIICGVSSFTQIRSHAKQVWVQKRKEPGEVLQFSLSKQHLQKGWRFISFLWKENKSVFMCAPKVGYGQNVAFI